MRYPLEDVRIVAIEQYGAGPWATMQLADLGAEVIKIEDPSTQGDVGRYVPPFQDRDTSLFFESFNRNKKSVLLDLKDSRGQHVLHDMVGNADAVFSNLRGDQPFRLGLRYADLAHFNPKIVCCALTGFGMTGPRAPEGAYDYTIQGLAGWMRLTGDPNGPPTKTGLSLVDLSAGYVAALALTAGVWRARRDGIGGDCDISLFETALSELAYVGTWAATRGYVAPRLPDSAHPSVVPFQNFLTEDGWIVVACPKEKFWVRLCHALGRDELASHEHYASFSSRLEHRDMLVRELSDVFAGHTTAYWVDKLARAGVPSSPVNDVAEAFQDVQAIAREALVEIDHPTLGIVRQPASPLRLDAVPDPGRAPSLGEHTRDVLLSVCSYSEGVIDDLEAAGVVSSGRAAAPADA